MDLKAFMAGEVPAIPGRGIGFTERPPRKPVIAAVEGYALAGGTEIVLATDLVVAAKNAKFGIPEVKRGLVAAGGGLLRLPQRIPYQKALELALTGDSFTAEEAPQLGLRQRAHRAGRGARRARSPWPSGSPRTARSRWRPPRRSSPSPRAGARTRCGRSSSELIMPVFSSKDAMEGATAFAEKRKPNWTGT